MQNFINNFFYLNYKILIINALLIFFLSSNAFSEDHKKDNYEFKSIKSDDANMRVGPGKRFEILWNFKKTGLPVKILKKFEQWYQVETPDGTIGWMWGKLLSNKQKTVIFKQKESIYKKNNLESDIIAYVTKNVILDIHFCKSNWCKVESKEHKIKGYVKTDNIWGAYIPATK